MATLKISDLSVGDWVECEGLHYPITFVGYGEGGDGSLAAFHGLQWFVADPEHGQTGRRGEGFLRTAAENVDLAFVYVDTLPKHTGD